MRTLAAALAAFAFMVLPAAAQSWTFDSNAAVASVARSGASLHVACARRGQLGLLYQFDQSLLAEELRGKRDAVFAFSDQADGANTIVDVPIRTERGKAFVAFYGDAAGSFAIRMAEAPRTVSAALGLPAESGYALFNRTQFPMAGSKAAIAKVVHACRR